MSDRTTAPKTGVAIQGWSGGTPDYEANRRIRPADRFGVGGLPGLYDEMVQQWSRVRANVAEAKDAARDLDVVTSLCGSTDDEPDGDESLAEREFNDALESLVLGDRLVVEVSDGHDRGIDAFLAWAVEAPIYGWCLAEAYWSTGAGLFDTRERIMLRPLLRAGVDRLRIDYGDPSRLTPTDVWYRTEWQAASWLEYELLVHLTDGGLPGQFFGHSPILRPLLALFDRYRSTLYNEDSYENAAKGLLTVEEPPGNNAENAARIDDLIDDTTAGRVTGFRHPNGTNVSWAFPSGSAPDYGTARDKLDMAVDHAFNSRMASLGISTHGSRAVAAEMGADDRRKASKRQNAFLNRAYQRLGAWVARQMGYRGRIRSLRSRDPESQIDPTATVGALAQAVQSGLLTWSPDDEAELRSQLGWRESTDVEPTPVAASFAEAANLPEKYSAINFDFPDAAVEEAERALEWSREYGRGGTDVGARRASQIAGRKAMSPDTWRRTKAFFDRFASQRERDGWDRDDNEEPSNLRIAWAMWGGDPMYAAARRVVESLDAADDDDTELADHATGCGCGSCGTAVALSEGEADGITIDAWGEVLPKPALAVEIDGVTVYPESFFPFAESERTRAQLDAALATTISEITTDHRAATWAALDGIGIEDYRPDAGELEDVFREYRGRYESEILSYLQRVEQASDAAARSSLDAQRNTSLSGGADVDDTLAEMTRGQIDAAIAQGRRAAESVASRVQSAVESSWTAARGNTAAARRTFTPGQTARGLASEARSAANDIESNATLRVAGSQEGDDRLPVLAMVRSAMRDANMCKKCGEEAGRRFRMPMDREAAMDYPALPDDKCEGTAKQCRCTWLILYGRR